MGPLADYNVLELATRPAASFAGLLLRYMGARVAMLEPEGGSPLREMPPFADGRSALFDYLSAGKRLLGPSRDFASLLDDVHIVLHDAPVLPGALETEMARSSLPPRGRVVVACTPYGQHGPKSSWDGTELTLFQAGGEGYLMPHGLPYEDNPDRPPIGMARYVAHYQGGIATALAAVSALRKSRMTEQVEHVDVSIQDAEASLNYFTVSRYVEGVREDRPSRAFKYAGLLRCLDGYVELVPLEQHQWEGLSEMLGSPKWASSPEMQDHLTRGRHGDVVNEHLRQFTEKRTVGEVVELATRHGIPCGPYIAPEDLPDVEQLQSRDYFIPSPDGEESDRFPGPPWVLDRWEKPLLNSDLGTGGEDDRATA